MIIPVANTVKLQHHHLHPPENLVEDVERMEKIKQ